MYVFKQIFRTLQVNNSRIPTIMNAKFSGYCFHRNSNIWGYFEVCISVPLLRYQTSRMNINHSKLGLVIKICHRNPCQPFSEDLLLGTLIICPVNALCIWDENTFIKNFYINYSFFNWISRSICAIVTKLNKCLSVFLPKKQIFYYLPDLQISNTYIIINNYYV